MIFRTPDIKVKHELEAQGYVCQGMHTIYTEDLKPSGKFEWEFVLPEQPVVEPKKALEEIQIESKSKTEKPLRGNPNWRKGSKKK